MSNTEQKKKLLFGALFATGLAGIVAEYCYATLSTYFVGDSVKQWSIVISLMLFSMGLGSRVTRSLKSNLLIVFITVEFILSLVVSFSAIITYFLATKVEYISLVIYLMALITGLLIGMELPLAIRLNKEFQSLEFNVANVLEKDYYGSLIGGLFFVFVGLPYLGLTYTPFLLGGINLSVALILIYVFRDQLNHKLSKNVSLIGLLIASIIIAGASLSEKIILHGEQNKYKDKIIYQDQSIYQKIIVTKWKNNYWLYLNENLQFSTFDEPMYHEVLIHPVMHLLNKPRKILILGGGDGCAARELLKYDTISSITLVDLDEKLTNLFSNKEDLIKINKESLLNPKITVINKDGFTFIENTDDFYDLIVIDLPDPRNIELSRLYSNEFYRMCLYRLTPKGGIITQAASPYYTPKAFKCIDKTISAAGFSTVPLHNQILTMGEWGWIIGVKEPLSKNELISKLKTFDEKSIQTRWLNNESISLITSFGKEYLINQKDSIEINKINKPILYHYYNQGNWDTY